MSEIANDPEPIRDGKRSTSTISDVSLSSQAFLTPKSKVPLLEKRIKLWKTRYQTLRAQIEFRKQSPLEKLKLYRQLNKSKRRNSTDNLIRFLDSRFRKVKHLNANLISNNRELARSLAQLRIESQEYCSESLNYQRELQTMEENFEIAVTNRLLELLADLTQPIVEKIEEGLSSVQEQTSRLTIAKDMICALPELVQRPGSGANLSYDDTDSNLSRDFMNTSGRTGGFSRKSAGMEISNESEEANENTNGSSNEKRWSCSKGNTNRRCKVLPMVMGHVLQQPKLALPKMDPQTLRAIARENREVARMENGFDMTVINERDSENVSEDEEDEEEEEEEEEQEEDVAEDSSDALERIANSISGPAMNPLLQNSGISGKYCSRLLANMASCKGRGRLVPYVSINADCSAAAVAALLAKKKSTDNSQCSEENEIDDRNSNSDEESNQQPSNHIQTPLSGLLSEDGKQTARQNSIEDEDNRANFREIKDPANSPLPLYNVTSLNTDSILSLEEQDSSAAMDGSGTKPTSKKSSKSKRSTDSCSNSQSSGKTPTTINNLTEWSVSSVSMEQPGNSELTSQNDDPLEGPSWLYSREATDEFCDVNKKTRRYITKTSKSSNALRSSKKAITENQSESSQNIEDTESTETTSRQSEKYCEPSYTEQPSLVDEVTLSKLDVHSTSSVQVANLANIESGEILSPEESQRGSFIGSLARRRKGRKSSVSFNDLVQVLEDETESRAFSRRTRAELVSFDRSLAERSVIPESTNRRPSILMRKNFPSNKKRLSKFRSTFETRNSTDNEFQVVLDDISTSSNSGERLNNNSLSNGKQIHNSARDTNLIDAEVSLEKSEIRGSTAPDLNDSTPLTPKRMLLRFEELEKMCPRRNRSRSKSGTVISLQTNDNRVDFADESEKSVVSVLENASSDIDSSHTLKEATVVLQRNIDPLLNSPEKSLLAETTKTSATSPCHSGACFSSAIETKITASEKSQSKRDNTFTGKKGTLNETCLEVEPMEMTLSVPSTSSEDFVQLIKGKHKSDQNGLNNANEVGAEKEDCSSSSRKVTDQVRPKFMRRGEGKPKENAEAKNSFQCTVENSTELDFSRLEGTVLCIPPYSPAKKSRHLKTETPVESSAKRLSIILVDVCKTEGARSGENIHNNDTELPRVTRKRAKNYEEYFEDGDETYSSKKIESSEPIAKRNKRRDKSTAVESSKPPSKNSIDKRKLRSNSGFSMTSTSKKRTKSKSLSYEEVNGMNYDEDVDALSKRNSNELKSLPSPSEDSHSDGDRFSQVSAEVTCLVTSLDSRVSSHRQLISKKTRGDDSKQNWKNSKRSRVVPEIPGNEISTNSSNFDNLLVKGVNETSLLPSSRENFHGLEENEVHNGKVTDTENSHAVNKNSNSLDVCDNGCERQRLRKKLSGCELDNSSESKGNATESLSQVVKENSNTSSHLKHFDEEESDVMRNSGTSPDEYLSPQCTPSNFEHSVENDSTKQKPSFSSTPGCSGASVAISDHPADKNIFLNPLEDLEPDVLKNKPEQNNLEDDSLPDLCNAENATDKHVNGKVNEQFQIGKTGETIKTQHQLVNGASTSNCGSDGTRQGSEQKCPDNVGDNEVLCNDGTASVTSHPRRAASKFVSYAEPKLNCKLRQGDSSFALRCDGAAQPPKSTTKKIRGKQR